MKVMTIPYVINLKYYNFNNMIIQMFKIISRLHRSYLYNLCAKNSFILLCVGDLFENAFKTGLL